MWQGETIFSVGDLTTASDKYKSFIKESYSYTENYREALNDRLEHIESIIERLEAEREHIKRQLREES